MQKRAAWQSELTKLVFEKLKFFDEAGMNLAMTRLFGRAVRGVRVEEGVPKNYGENISLPGVLSATGLEAVMTVNGAVDTEVLKVYVEEILAQVLRTGDRDGQFESSLLGNGGFGNCRLRSASYLSAAVFAGFESDRKMLVKDQNGTSGS